MASITLAQADLLSQDLLVQGIIEDIVTVNPIFDSLPFDRFSGTGIAYNRENVLGDVQVSGVGDTITAKSPSTYTEINDRLTRIIGDAEVDNLIDFVESETSSQSAQQIAGKAKAAGREYQRMLVNGTGAANEFTGLLSLCDPSQKIDTGTDGSTLSLEILDSMMQLVTAKDGEVDFLMMHGRTLVSYYKLIRELGGTSMSEVATVSGRVIDGYRRIPIFRNDWIPINQTKGSGGAVKTTIFAGVFDDGSRKTGLAGLTAARDAGISLVQVGEKEDKDEKIYRIRWYCGLALFSARAIACADGISN
jgi:Type 2A encapsulin shell protein SrpI-like